MSRRKVGSAVHLADSTLRLSTRASPLKARARWTAVLQRPAGAAYGVLEGGWSTSGGVALRCGSER